MIRKKRFTWAMSAGATLFFSASIGAQKLHSSLQNDPSQRVQIAPESVFQSFREAGMKPLNHKLTPQPFYVVVTKNKVELARFEPMKQELVKRRLHQLTTFYES